jgi:hypothetical protein
MNYSLPAASQPFWRRKRILLPLVMCIVVAILASEKAPTPIQGVCGIIAVGLLFYSLFAVKKWSRLRAAQRELSRLQTNYGTAAASLAKRGTETRLCDFCGPIAISELVVVPSTIVQRSLWRGIAVIFGAAAMLVAMGSALSLFEHDVERKKKALVGFGIGVPLLLAIAARSWGYSTVSATKCHNCGRTVESFWKSLTPSLWRMLHPLARSQQRRD